MYSEIKNIKRLLFQLSTFFHWSNIEVKRHLNKRFLRFSLAITPNGSDLLHRVADNEQAHIRMFIRGSL